jgi:hypothetical protein
VLDLLYVRCALGGLLNSAHCVGMCGAFALGWGGMGGSTAGTAGRLILYNLGRIATYTFLGALGGLVGFELLRGGPAWARHLPGVVAGVLTAALGLHLAGGFGTRLPGLSIPADFFARLMSPLLRHDRVWAAPAFGLFNGLLPCGLVYAFVLEAAAAGSPGAGALTMLCFGLGTLPALTALGLTGARLSPSVRARVLTVGAVLIVALGLYTAASRAAAWATHADAPAAACPLCGSE